MKKSIVALLIVLALVVLISPGIVGMLAEKSVDEQIEWIRADNEDLVITAERFDRGWFSSQGRHRIEMRDSTSAASLKEILGLGHDEPLPALIVHTELNHGPIALSFVAGEKASLAPGLGNAVSRLSIEMADGEVVELPGTIRSSVTLAGDLTSNYTARAGSQAFATWGDINIDFESSPSHDAYAYDGRIEALQLNEQYSGAAISNLSFSGDLTMSEFDFAIGDLRVALDTLSPGSGAASEFTIGPLVFDTTSIVTDGRVDSSSEFSIVIDNIPNVGQVGLETKLAVESMDGEALNALIRGLQAVQAGSNSADAMLAIEPELLALVAAGLKMRIEQLDVAVPLGTIKSAVNITVFENDSADLVWASLLLSLEAAAQFEIPAAIADMAMMMMPQAGIIEGFLRKNGDVYELEAAYKKGLLTVNGIPLPIPVP